MVCLDTVVPSLDDIVFEWCRALQVDCRRKDGACVCFWRDDELPRFGFIAEVEFKSISVANVLFLCTRLAAHHHKVVDS